MDAIKELLEAKYRQYNRPEFIETDPIQIPHLFKQPEDIEIAGFLAATLAWGQRKTIIQKSRELLRLMNDHPYRFITKAADRDFSRFGNFSHRTFNATDTLFFLYSLRMIYTRYGGLRQVFEEGFSRDHQAGTALAHFRRVFLEPEHPDRIRKHVPDINRGASAKRLNMFLRWMVRKDTHGVDFGIWQRIDPAWLSVPLDLHTGAAARKLGLLTRKQNDWQGVCELTDRLRLFDPHDPVKYDFALFGLHAFETPRRGVPTPTGSDRYGQ